MLLAAVAGEGGWVWGQGPAGEKSGRPAAGETRRGERGREESSRVDTKPAGRLPAYYGEVVSKEQRARIYEIQGRIQEQIARLRDQIEALDRQLQSDVEAVLTPEQREQVQKRVAEAKAKRAQRIAERAQAGPSTTE